MLMTMARRMAGDKPLSKPIMAYFTDKYASLVDFEWILFWDGI